ncbi:MAG: hypothetical protein D6690_13220 [Nitrospirae bacterium]|nr:MAG: hypothetical protein D6690_13220 [Nitrospirota bacterium]
MISWTVVLGAIVLIAGCGYDPIVVSDRAGIAEGATNDGRAVVLFRLFVTEEGRSPMLSPVRWSFESFEMGLARIDAGEQMKRVQVLSPSSALASQGWMFMKMNPGRYQLWIVPPAGSLSILGAQDTHRTIPDIHLDIPSGARWVYAGSLHLVCSPRAGFWGNMMPTHCANTVNVVNEAQAARRVIEQVARRPVPFIVRLGVPHRWKVNDSRLRTVMPIVKAQKKPIRWVRPDWRRRALERVGITPQGVEWSMWGFGGISTIAYLLYLPFGILTGELLGASDQDTWKDCVDRWQETFQQSDLQRHWNQMMRRALEMKVNGLAHDRRSHAARSDAEPAVFIWETGVERVQLRECEERGSFCLELAVRLQIRERSAEEGQLVYDGFLLYSNPAARPVPFSEQPFSQAQLPVYRTYEIPLSDRAPCRNLKFYCADENARLLHEEVSQVFSRMISYFLTDLGINAETSQDAH